jgi:LemA protein
MKKLLAVAGIGVVGLLVLAGIVAFTVIGLRNSLVVMEEDVDNQWAQVEVQYQRRYDLIPNLVASVRGYLEQERDIFTELAEARTRYGSAASGSTEQVEAANELEGALSRLLVIMENYPELKSDQTVVTLMVELEGTENRISVERSRYNEKVTDFNKKIRVFPNNVINDLFLHFDEKVRFESVAGAENAPEVDLSFEEDVAPESAPSVEEGMTEGTEE